MTFLYIVAIIIIFIVTGSLYLAKRNDPDGLNWTCVLYNSGAKYTYSISKKGHVHRLLVPMFLHANAFHLIMNVLGLLWYGCITEYMIGPISYIIVLFLGSVGGSAFSAVLSPYSLSVGASSAVFALLAVCGVLLWFNWHKMSQWKYLLLIYFIAIIVLAIIHGFSLRSRVDVWAHLGGFIAGLGVAPLVIKAADDPRKRLIFWLRVGGAILLVAYFVAMLLATFLRPLPKCYEPLNSCELICAR